MKLQVMTVAGGVGDGVAIDVGHVPRGDRALGRECERSGKHKQSEERRRSVHGGW